MKVGGGREFRVADFIRQQLAEIIRSEMHDPRIELLSITDVRISKDLSYADIYVSSMSLDADLQTDAEERKIIEVLEVLNNASGFLRSAIAKRHSMRITPKLRFHYDALIDSGPRMEKVISRALKADESQRVLQPSTEHKHEG